MISKVALFSLIHSCILISAHLVLVAGLFHEMRRQKRVLGIALTGGINAASTPRLTDTPLVSLVIPARNEGKRLRNLLKSLTLQTYSNVEYIFINDRSTDNTEALLLEFAQKQQRVTIINLSENPGPNHKQYALAKGIVEACGSFILFTDADCAVSPNWIRCMVDLMADENCGIIIAPVFKQSTGPTLLSRYQCFDHAIRCVYMVGTTGFGAGFCGFGNNLMLRKKALDEAGGYENVPFTLTEDAALIAYIRAHTRYTVQAASLPDLYVSTESEPTWKAFNNQALRWNNGALFSRDFRTCFSYRYLMLSVLCGLFALPAGFINRGLFFVAAGSFVIIVVMSLCAFILFGKMLPKNRLCYLLEILFMPFFFSFLTILGFAGIIPVWKDNQPSKFYFKKSK